MTPDTAPDNAVAIEKLPDRPMPCRFETDDPEVLEAAILRGCSCPECEKTRPVGIIYNS